MCTRAGLCIRPVPGGARRAARQGSHACPQGAGDAATASCPRPLDRTDACKRRRGSLLPAFAELLMALLPAVAWGRGAWHGPAHCSASPIPPGLQQRESAMGLDADVSLRPLSLRPGAGVNPFAGFAKGAGAGLKNKASASMRPALIASKRVMRASRAHSSVLEARPGRQAAAGGAARTRACPRSGWQRQAAAARAGSEHALLRAAAPAAGMAQSSRACIRPFSSGRTLACCRHVA